MQFQTSDNLSIFYHYESSRAFHFEVRNFQKIRKNAKGEEIMPVNETGPATTSSNLMGFALKGLETNKEYVICISTIVNGRLLSKLTRQVKPKII